MTITASFLGMELKLGSHSYTVGIHFHVFYVLFLSDHPSSFCLYQTGLGVWFEGFIDFFLAFITPRRIFCLHCTPLHAFLLHIYLPLLPAYSVLWVCSVRCNFCSITLLFSLPFSPPSLSCEEKRVTNNYCSVFFRSIFCLYTFLTISGKSKYITHRGEPWKLQSLFIYIFYFYLYFLCSPLAFITTGVYCLRVRIMHARGP